MEKSEIQKFIHLGGKLANIEKFLQDLQSDNPDQRLYACEKLIYAVWVPDNAIEALRKATKDSDPTVAEMARKALDVQLHDRYMNQRFEETGSWKKYLQSGQYFIRDFY